MQDEHTAEPDNTAVRTALWRALHVQADAPPHVFKDEVGLKLVAPDDDWRNRPDMSSFTKPFRAAILARARYIEDLVEEQVSRGVGQYVLLGAGLDSFAQRKPELASQLRVFELGAWAVGRIGATSNRFSGPCIRSAQPGCSRCISRESGVPLCLVRARA